MTENMSQDSEYVLDQPVVDLVIAAREFWDGRNDLSEESRALDKALEKFAAIVPYENGPDGDAAPSTPLPQGEVARLVKPLKWEPARNGDWYANSVVGQYAAGVVGGKTYTVIIRLVHDGQDNDEVIARDVLNHTEAKAAAQADYERRTLSAIDTDALSTLVKERGAVQKGADEFYAELQEAVKRAEAAETALASSQAKLREALEAMRHIKPYLVWTVGPESPSHHPTMPSAVYAFLDALRTLGDTQ